MLSIRFSLWEVLGFILLLALSNAISPAVDHAIMDNFQPMVDHLIKHGTEEQLAALLPMEGDTHNLRHDPPVAHVVTPAEPLPDPTGKAKALFDLLQQWRDEDAAMSPEEQAEADQDLDEFKRNINANRAATGEEPVY